MKSHAFSPVQTQATSAADPMQGADLIFRDLGRCKHEIERYDSLLKSSHVKI